MGTFIRAALVAAPLLAGCSTFDNQYDSYADKHSAYQLVSRDEFEPIDLASLISGEAPTVRAANAGGSGQVAENRAEGARIDKAFAVFAATYRDTDTLGRARRSEIQERILAASDQRCNDFKTLLQKKFSNVSFNTGILSSVTAVAATIVSNVDTSRTLAGIAGISSAYRAEYNQAFFANAAVQVVVAGIDSRRRTAYEQILHARSQSLATYPLEAAVKDAIRYHGLCSTVSGLQEAGEAVRYYNEPGITAATRTVARSRMLMDIQNASGEQVIERLKRWQEVIPAERYLAGNPLGEEEARGKPAGDGLIDHFVQTVDTIRRKGAELGKELDAMPAGLAPSTDIDTAKAVAGKTEKALADNCQATVQARSANLDLLKAKLALLADAGESQLQLDVKRAAQSADMTKASIDFVATAYGQRATNLLLAIRERKAAAAPAGDTALLQALAKWNAFAPVVAGECDVQRLE